MNAKLALPFPMSLLLLDGVGALLFALGAAGHFSGVKLLSAALPRVPRVDLLAMLVGGVLMACAMAGIVRAMVHRGRESYDRASVPGGATQPGLASPLQKPRR